MNRVGSRVARSISWRYDRASRWLRGWWITVSKNKVRLEGCTFDVSNPAIDLRTKSDLKTGLYELDERTFLSQLPSDLPLIELGACIGVVACLSSQRLLNPQDHIVVEANPRMISTIRTNAALNRAPFKLRHSAISGNDSLSVEFSIGDWVLANRVGSVHGSQVVSVPAATLRQLCNDFGIVAPFSLICDIEGAEIALVERERECFNRVAWFMVEVHPGISGDIAVSGFVACVQSTGLQLVSRKRDTLLFVRSALRGKGVAST